MWFKKRIKEEKLENVPVYDEEPYQGRTFEKFKESQELPTAKSVFFDLLESIEPEFNNVDALMDEIESIPVEKDTRELQIEILKGTDIRIPEDIILMLDAVADKKSGTNEYESSVKYYFIALDEEYTLYAEIRYRYYDELAKIYITARTKEYQDYIKHFEYYRGSSF